LRAQGIPARIVEGYAQGEWVEEASLYRVRASNAHSWAEVYFPEFGWIQFEPTASIPVTERPEEPLGGNAGDAFGINNPLEAALNNSQLSAEDLELLDPASRDARLQELLAAEESSEAMAIEQRNGRIVTAVGGGMLLLFAGGLVTFANQANKKIESDVEKSYGRLSSWARWLDIGFRPVDTPYERADRLSQSLPEGRTSIRSLTHQYVLRRFSPEHRGDDSFDPTSEWKLLRPMLLRRTIRQQWQRLRSLRLRDLRLPRK